MCVDCSFFFLFCLFFFFFFKVKSLDSKNLPKKDPFVTYYGLIPSQKNKQREKMGKKKKKERKRG